MVIWGLVVGAIVGLAASGWPGLLAGALAGLGAALWLDQIVKARIATATQQLRRQIEAELRDDRPDAAAAPFIPQPAPPSPSILRMTVATPPPEAPEPVLAPALEGVAFRQSPSQPDALERLLAIVRGWLLGGNTIVRLGVVILFVGLSFLVRYAAMAGLLPIELRLAAVGAVGVALLGVGFWRRTARPEFGLVLQGAGVAVIYLTLFGAARLFHVLPPTIAFALMVVVCGLGCALALLQNAQSLAVAAFVGGFAVPVLLGGEGSSVGLFGYYAVLNLAVLGVGLWREWRAVKLIGFFATFGVATAWGVLAYKPADYATSQAFLALFVIIYLAAAVLRPRRAERAVGRTVDSVLLFGPALIGFGLQVGLVRDVHYGSAFSALGFAAVYVVLAALVSRRKDGTARLIFDALLAIAVGFITLAIPLGMGVRWTAAPWAVEGAAAFWVGMRQTRWTPRLFGLAMIVAAGLAYLAGAGDLGGRVGPLGPLTLGAAIIAAAALLVAWWLRRPLPAGDSRLAAGYAGGEAMVGKPLFFYGFVFWCVAFMVEISRSAPQGAPFIPHDVQPLAIMLLFAISAAVAASAGWRKAWPVATWPGRGTLAVMALTLVVQSFDGHHVPELPDLPFWIAALGVHGWLLWRWDRAAAGALDPLSRALHVGGVWLLTAMLADALWLAIDRARLWDTSWAAVTGLVATTVVLLVLTFWSGRSRTAWPLASHAVGYFWQAAAPIAALVYLGALGTAFLSPGEAAPLPYAPLLNPVDLACGLALAGLLAWRRMLEAATPTPAGVRGVTGWEAMVAWAALALLIVNTVWLRLTHHYLGIAWTVDAMMGSPIVQAGVSILWTVLALSLMLFARRRANRAMWLTGAGLLGAVVVKLLLVDMSATSGGARIVAFIVIGVLMLVVGYFAPLPPRRAQAMGAGE